MKGVFDPQARPAYPGVFAFETDFAGTLVCIPMSVRMKLDQVGIKLSLKQWNRMPEEARRELIDRSCTEAAATADYRGFLIGLIEKFTASAAEQLPPEPAPAWADATEVPERITRWAQAVGVPGPSPGQWAALTPLQRFTLFKLTRPGHSNENFVPAMREFRLLS